MSEAAAIYCRISRDPEDLQQGVQRQREDCEAYAARKGWRVAEVYVDNDVSGYRGDPPEWRRMLRDIKAGERDAVVIYDVDRLTRQPRLFEEFLDTCQRVGVRNLGSVGGDLDLGSEDGEFTARILVAVAKKESDAKSRRIRRSLEAKALRGEYRRGGKRPFGYMWDDDSGRLVLHEEEAALLREAAKRILAGESRRRITQDWHEKGLRTSEGKPWSITRLGQLLAHPRIVGKRIHKGEVVVGVEADWPPILDEATQERVVRRMRRHSSGSRPGRQRHLLTGIAVCGRCGSRLTAKARRNHHGERFRTYRCSNDSAETCGQCSVIAEPLEQLVLWTAWVWVAPEPEAVFAEVAETANEHDPRAADLRAAIQEVLDRESDLSRDHYELRVVSRETFLETAARLRDERDDLERALRRLERSASQAGVTWTADQVRQVTGPPATLTGAEPEEVEFWRAIVQSVFERVEIKAPWSGRRFSADRVVLHPKPEFKDATVPYHSWDLPSAGA